MSPRDQCLHIARWIPRGIDMFCSLRDVFCTANLVRQDEAAQDLSEPEDEAVEKERKEMLSHLYVFESLPQFQATNFF